MDCLPGLDQKPTNIEIKACPEFNFGESLQNVYPLLEIIFGYLNCRDLKAVSKVSTEWSKVALKELQKRNEVRWFTCALRGIKSQPADLVTSSNFHYSNGQMGIILYEGRKHKLDKYMCIHDYQNKTAKRITCE